jgi:hypothetical protein
MILLDSFAQPNQAERGRKQCEGEQNVNDVHGKSVREEKLAPQPSRSRKKQEVGHEEFIKTHAFQNEFTGHMRARRAAVEKVAHFLRRGKAENFLDQIVVG